MLPNFIVIGAAKCGTSSVSALLGSHPDVFMCDPKEPHFFGRNDPKKTRNWYESLFQGAEGKAAIGEGSTSYTHPQIIEEAASEIAALIPQCRLIYMVRHPIRRLESDWKMRVREGWGQEDINEASTKQESLITHGMYWRNLQIYLSKFPSEQILVVFLEDLARDPGAVLSECFRHIQVDASVGVRDLQGKRNTADSQRKVGVVWNALRRNAFLRSVRDFSPDWAIAGARRLLTLRYETNFEWDLAVKRSVIRVLEPDAERLLKYCQRPPGFWDLAN